MEDVFDPIGNGLNQVRGRQKLSGGGGRPQQPEAAVLVRQRCHLFVQLPAAEPSVGTRKR